MKLKLLFIAMALSTFSLGVFAQDQTSTPEPTATSQSPADTTTAPPPGATDTMATANAQKDGEALAFLIVVNKHEVAAANEAMKHKVDSSIKNYANLLRKDHNKNLQDTLKLSRKIHMKPVDTDEITQLKEKGDKELADMKPMDTQQFQVAYIDAMVKGHSEALEKIDQFMNQVSNPQVKKHLEMTRAVIARHLEKAKMIQSKLQSQPSTSQTTPSESQ